MNDLSGNPGRLDVLSLDVTPLNAPLYQAFKKRFP
jgi:hypothetical protein